MARISLPQLSSRLARVMLSAWKLRAKAVVPTSGPGKAQVKLVGLIAVNLCEFFALKGCGFCHSENHDVCAYFSESSEAWWMTDVSRVGITCDG